VGAGFFNSDVFVLAQAWAWGRGRGGVLSPMTAGSVGGAVLFSF